MTKFLTASETHAVLERIIKSAKSELTLISPYIKLPPVIFERIQSTAQRGIPISLVCRKKDLKIEVEEQLRGISGLHIRFMDNLHAKCYSNEHEILITSMNLYDYSIAMNREVGILLTRTDDAYENAATEIAEIIQAAVPLIAEVKPTTSMLRHVQSIFGRAEQPAAARTASPRHGHCLRCRASIPRNETRPLCAACYHVWAEYGNPDYVESYCHMCGKGNTTSMNKPLCRPCYNVSA